MGEARRRGTFEERRDTAIEKYKKKMEEEREKRVKERVERYKALKRSRKNMRNHMAMTAFIASAMSLSTKSGKKRDDVSDEVL